MTTEQLSQNFIALLPPELVALAHKCPFPLYVVGGTCRDYLCGFQPKKHDYDICAPVPVDDFLPIAQQCGIAARSVYKNTGTVKLTAKEEYEFASFRSDLYVRGTHTPQGTFFTTDILLDANRRDFTVNAIYYDIKAQKFVDPLGGIADVQARVMNTTRAPDQVFGEDGLRLMRLARQASALGFTPSKECLQGAKNNCALIDDISVERIFAELDYILHGDEKYGVLDAPYMGLKLLRECGVLARILPELALGDGMEQRKDYHDHDVLEHSLRCVKYARVDIRLAALLHDVGKPQCYLTTGKFAGHETVGAEIARHICAKYKVSNALTDETCRLIKVHMYDLSLTTRPNKVRKKIVDYYDIFDKVLALKQADFSACKDDLSEAPCVTRWKTIFLQMQNEGAPFTLKQLSVRGDELIRAGISPAQTGKVLKELLYLCAMDPTQNQKEKLILHALQFAKTV